METHVTLYFREEPSDKVYQAGIRPQDGGYASSSLNPEPFAYEGAFAVRWLIQDETKGTAPLSYADGKSPLLLWGPISGPMVRRAGRRAISFTSARTSVMTAHLHPRRAGKR